MGLPLIITVTFLIAVIIIIINIIMAHKIYFLRLHFKLPPGPFPLPIIGNYFQLNAEPILYHGLTKWSKVYGPIFSVFLGPNLSIVVNTVEMAQQVLKDNDLHLANRNRTMLIAKFSKNGTGLMWSDYGPHYVKLRKLCSLQLFSTKRMEALRPIREEEVAVMVQSIFNDYCINPENMGQALVLREYLEKASFLHIARLTFGKRFLDSDGNIDALGQELKKIMANESKLYSKESIAEYLPWLSFLFKAENQALDDQVAMADCFMKKLILEESTTLSRDKTGDTRNHFLDALLTLQKEYDLSEDTITGLLWDMIYAGIESIIISVEWGMAEIVRNPRVQKKIQEELDRVIGHECVMTEDDILNLHYLQCAIKESFRLHPPFLLPHQATTNVNISGYDVPKGATVTVNTLAIGRDPAVWKDPLEFRPERFQEEDIDMKGTDFRLLPFGSGRRSCPSTQLSINFLSSMFGHMLHHLSWAPPPGMKPDDMDMTEELGIGAYMRTPLQAVPTPRLSADHLFKRFADVGNI